MCSRISVLAIRCLESKIVNAKIIYSRQFRPEFFYKLIYGIFFSDLGSRGRKKINKKALVIFRAFFQSFFSELFFLISPENSKTSEVNQQCVLNLNIFHHFPKNLDRTITFKSVTLKNTQTEPKKYIIFFSTKRIIFRVGG